MLASWQDWIAWAGLVLPLSALSWAAVFFVKTWRGEIMHKRYQKFFSLMDIIGGPEDVSIVGKMAAIYELKRYPEYREVILRLCRDLTIVGSGKDILERELDLTAKHFGSHRG